MMHEMVEQKMDEIVLNAMLEQTPKIGEAAEKAVA